MAYRYDADLEFFDKIDSADFNDLVSCLTRDKDGELRIVEGLTNSPEYKMYAPNHHMYWKNIAAEIQTFGANTFVTVIRGGKGVLYKEVLSDVCDKLKVKYDKNSSAEKIEMRLLEKILEDSLKKMSPEQLQSLADVINMNELISATPQAMTLLVQTIFRQGGFKSYQLTLIVANAVSKQLLGRGLTLVANQTLVRVMGVLTGPIGWAITAAWTLFDMAGAAYRVTIPAVILVSFLRQKHLYALASDVIINTEKGNTMNENTSNQTTTSSVPTLGEIISQIQMFRNYTPKIAIFGDSGAGKSSLLNAMFGEMVAKVSDVVAGTTEIKEYPVPGKKLILVDTPGIGENPEKHKEYLNKYKQKLPDIDCILWVIKADDRANASSLDAFNELFEDGKQLPIIFVISQTDKINPSKEWNYEKFEPGAKQKISIEDKVKQISELFQINSSRIVSVAFDDDTGDALQPFRKYNIDKLIETIVDVVPDEKKYAFVRESEEDVRTRKSTSQAEEGIWSAIKKFAGDAWDKHGEAIKNHFMENAPKYWAAVKEYAPLVVAFFAKTKKDSK